MLVVWFPLVSSLLLLRYAFGDVYLHNPRGSNNRLDEQTRERTNANNLFDSQNNDRGGYNVGSLYYYQGSVLPIEWTNQHSCQNPNCHCDIILQYMCDNQVRDGATTQTIPTNRAACENYDCDQDRRYRMNENYAYYTECSMRERNKNLFTADQNLNNRNRAQNTRQNPQGTRRGYECPEERDYYPYWHPSPWVDIAVMTNNVSRCPYYKKESQNVQSRWACVLPIMEMEKLKDKIILPNNKEACEKYKFPSNVNGSKPEWKNFPAHGIPAPDCRETEYTRDNHLGNGLGGHPIMYNWTIPDYIEHENCVLRIRYNISTSDYEPWTTNSSYNADPKNLNKGSLVNMAEKFGFTTEAAARARGYVFKNNPVLNIFNNLTFDLRLAIDTAQYGRVFQDRSHTFAVRKRSVLFGNSVIYNLNVRGKRGNIVQVYPAVEYDFVPMYLEVSTESYVHVQWTGSNTNPNNNDGQGLAGTDRSNIVLLGSQVYPEGNANNNKENYGHFGVNNPMAIENATFLSLSSDDALTLAFVNPGQFRGEVSELDDAGTYFNLLPRKVTQKGTYKYMSTRNNNFSNRDQKGKITVTSTPYKTEAIGKMGGILSLEDGVTKMTVEEGTFDSLKIVRLEMLSETDGVNKLKAANRELKEGDNFASDFIVIQPQELFSNQQDKSFTLDMKISDDSNGVEIYHANIDYTVWSKVEARIQDGRATVQARSGGVWVARRQTNIGMIVGIVVACVAVVAIVLGTIFYFRHNPTKWQAVRTTCRNAKRSTRNRV
uniref:Protein DD3-3 n=3 Tax=Arion vulgaris TaxID=1028688 RepID=A0A0B7ALW1_9EUPU